MKFFMLESLFRGDSCRDKMSLGCNFFLWPSHKITVIPQPMVAIHSVVSWFHAVSWALCFTWYGLYIKKQNLFHGLK